MKELLQDEIEGLRRWHSGVSEEHWNDEGQNSRGDLEVWITWQWNNNPDSILDAMKFWVEDKNVALEILVQGQRKEWQDRYRIAGQEVTDFWWTVFYTPWLEADFESLKIVLERQVRDNWNLLWESWDAWNLDSSQNMWSYYYLLLTQLTDPRSLENIRACWYKDRERVMSIVREAI